MLSTRRRRYLVGLPPNITIFVLDCDYLQALMVERFVREKLGRRALLSERLGLVNRNIATIATRLAATATPRYSNIADCPSSFHFLYLPVKVFLLDLLISGNRKNSICMSRKVLLSFIDRKQILTKYFCPHFEILR